MPPDGETSSVALFSGFGHCLRRVFALFSIFEANPCRLAPKEFSQHLLTQAEWDREIAVRLGQKLGE